ncbi:hypothetical protein CDEF62S_05366 [Castellaniella defragrans]
MIPLSSQRVVSTDDPLGVFPLMSLIFTPLRSGLFACIG